MTKLQAPIDDRELDRRLRATFQTVMPMLDNDQIAGRKATPTALSDERDSDLDLDLDLISVYPVARRARFATVGALLLGAAAVLILLVIVTQRDTGTPDPAAASAEADETAVRPAAPAVPGWYSSIRPLLPEGFDQIALTQSTAQSINFVAFRTDTHQLLEVALSFEPGFGKKETSDPVTFEDSNGSYKESPGGVWLDTTDDRYVSIRCGLVPIGTGGSGDVGATNGERDDCGNGFDHLDLDAGALRALATNLATRLVLTPGSSGIDGVTQGAPVAPATESDAVVALITDYVGSDRVTFPMGQFGGVIRASNLSPIENGPMTTQLSIIHGMYPPRIGDDVATNVMTSLAVIPPSAEFRFYDNIAVAMVVSGDGTGFHIATNDLDSQHLTELGILLDHLSNAEAASSSPSPGTTTPTSVTAPLGVATALEAAMAPAGTVLVVNATDDASLAGALTDAIEDSGYDVVAPVDAIPGTNVSDTIIYFQQGTPSSTRNNLVVAIPVLTAQELQGQPTPAVTASDLSKADVIIVLGEDLADTSWTPRSPLVPAAELGTLLVLDASGTTEGQQRTQQVIATMRSLGVDVVDGGPASRQLEQTMLMPIGDPTRWSWAVAELAEIGGFDTWSPDLVSTPLSPDVNAVIAVGGGS